MAASPRVGLPRLRYLLASSSVVAILISGGTPHALAACTPVPGSGVSNSGTVSGYCVSGTVNGGITNSGAITATGISFTNGTLNGKILNNGTIVGGITLDHNSSINTSRSSILLQGPTFTGGISNAGTIVPFLPAFAIEVNGGTTFGGGISNSGVVGSFGIAVGGVRPSRAASAIRAPFRTRS